MTCKEKLKLDHPDLNEDQLFDMTRSYCPFEVGINYPPLSICCDSKCSDCWNREIPGTENIKKENEIMPTHAINVNTKRTKAELIEEIKMAHDHIQEMENQIKNLERYKQYEDMANELKAMHTAFMNSGFSDEQAFEMVKTITESSMPAVLRSVGL